MDHDEVLLAKLERATRSVSRWSTATKGICVVALGIAAILLLYGLSRIGHSDDLLAFGLLALAVAAVATLFWSIAAFHTAVSHSLSLIASAHSKLDLLAERARRKRDREGTAPTDAPPALPAGPAPLTAPSPAPVAVAVPVAGPATMPLPMPVPAQAPPPAPAPAVPAAAASLESTLASASPPSAPAKREVTPAVPTKECPHCSGDIREDATRCRWCMKQVA
jgi:hypothetical protein